MSAKRRQRLRPHRQRGFTLVEMLAALAIVAVLSAAAMPLVRTSGERWTPRTVALDIAAELREMRGAAIAANATQAFTVDAATRTYGRRGHVLPASVALAVEGQGDGLIRFYPDGASNGGRVRITGGGETILISVDWLTGRVSAERSP